MGVDVTFKKRTFWKTRCLGRICD